MSNIIVSGVERNEYEARIRRLLGAVKGNRTQHFNAVARRNKGVFPPDHECSTCNMLALEYEDLTTELGNIYGRSSAGW